MIEQLNSKNDKNKRNNNTVAKEGSIQDIISYYITNNKWKHDTWYRESVVEGTSLPAVIRIHLP